MRKLTLLFIIGIAFTTVHASDGVFEINEDCSLFGCFDGDTSGFPVTIANSGSYRLTGNLTTNNLNETLIQVSADEVTIDLNGFSLIGPVTCSGSPNACSGAGTGDGIRADSNDASVTVFNGRVTGVGRDGIWVGNGSQVKDVQVLENGGNGLVLAGTSGSIATNVIARRNGGTGISPGFASHLVMDSTMVSNTVGGIFGGFCSNILSIGGGTETCVGIAPNRCDTPTDCD
ncbi:MAG: hypothetical protein AAGJ52_02220 [Pseudomonadota bacterium]